MTPIPRRHHYVTKAYLEGFLEPGENNLCCYTRKRSAPFLSAPTNLANIRDFHSFKRPDGSIDCSLETQIEREIETPGIPIIRMVISGKTNLDFGQRLSLAKLVALQSVRVPFERNFMDSNNVDNLSSYLEEMDEASRKLNAPVNAIDVAVTPRDDPRLIKKWARITREQILAEIREAREDPRKSSRDTLVLLAGDLAKVFVQMEWIVYQASGTGCFITSDRPVVRTSTDNKGFGRGIRDLRSEISFPLSSTVMLRMKHYNWLLDEIRKRRPNEIKPRRKAPSQEIANLQVEDEFVELSNRTHANQAHLLVFSGRKQDWLCDWMHEPLKSPKRAVAVSDTELNLSTHRQPAKMTRKREFIIQDE
jgi:hypothetical protein